MKLKIMISSVKSKVVVKFGSSEVMYVELRAKKLHVKVSSSHVQNTSQPCRLSMKLKIMTVSIKTKMVNKFDSSEVMYVELRAKKL